MAGRERRARARGGDAQQVRLREPELDVDERVQVACSEIRDAWSA